MFVTNFSQFAVGSTIEFNCISSHAKSTFDEYIVTGNIFTPGFPARMIILGIAVATGNGAQYEEKPDLRGDFTGSIPVDIPTTGQFTLSLELEGKECDTCCCLPTVGGKPIFQTTGTKDLLNAQSFNQGGVCNLKVRFVSQECC